MCEFCTKHGEGKIWYLKMENYSKELLNLANRKEFIKDLILTFEEKMNYAVKKLENLNNSKLPISVKNFIKNIALRKQKKLHYGQIVPIEDVEKLLEFTDKVTFLTCACRKVTRGKEKKYCFGLSVPPADIPEEILKKYPNSVESLEVLDKTEALKIIKEFDRKGLYHSVWTFKTPYIGGLCNCDMDCLAFRVRQYLNFPAFFKSEYVGSIDEDNCKGCRNCQKFCQFGAINFSFYSRKCYINREICTGCGVCRNVCEQNAIKLEERRKIPQLSKNW